MINIVDLRLYFQSDKKFYYILNFICSLFLVLHLCFLAYDFSNCKKVEKVVSDSTTDDRFPSFSLCSNVPIRQGRTQRSTSTEQVVHPDNAEVFDLFTFAASHQFLTSSHYQNKSIYWEGPPLTKKTEFDVLSQFAKLNEAQRLEYSLYPFNRLGLRFYLNNSLIGIQPYKNIKYLLSNNLYYGNCMTFNSAWVKDAANPAGIVLQNDVQFHRNGLTNQTDMPWKNEILVFHPVDTEPIFDSRNVIKIPTDSKTFITISKTKYDLKTECVENLKPENGNGDFEYDDYFDERNYTYSYEGCLASCLQNLTIEYCACQLPYLQLINDMRVCRGCRNIPQKELDVQCGCKYPCSYFRLELLTESITHAFSKTEEKLLEGNKEFHMDIGDDGFAFERKFIYRLGETRITVLKSAAAVQTTIIESSCKSEVLFSQIGGILGLYMGLSIFSFVEIIFQSLSKLRVKKLQQLLENRNGNQFSISVANHLRNSQTPMKVMWIIILCGASYTTFYQSVILFQAYYEYPVIYQMSEVKQVEFPSVTVCSNNLVPVKQNDENKKFLDSLKLKAYNASSSASLNMGQLWYLQVLYQAQPLTTRLSMGTPLKSYMPTCYYTINNKKINCSKLIEYSLGSKHGNCVTINAGILKEGDEETNITSITMELRVTEPKHILLVEELGVIVIIHPKGTSANNYQFRKNFMMKPRHFYEIAFSTTVRKHLPEPYPTKCVSQTDSFHQWRNLFHTHETPYLYTLGECMASCDFNNSLLKRCMDGIHFNNQGRLTIPGDIGFDNCVVLSSRPCNCEMPCREVEFEFEVVKVNKTGEYAGETEGDEEMIKWFGNAFQPSLNYSLVASSWLKLYPKAMKSTIIREEPAIQLSTLLSDIGGTLGLWLGISVLALAELNCVLLFKLFKI